ncbi:MAG TPA: glycosyltransferase family 4 protein [Acidobacteriota bacterium]
MRLGFVSDGNSPYVQALARHFAHQRGWEVHLISLRPLQRGMEGVTTHDLGCRSKLGYLLRIPRVRRLVARIRPDVLIGYRIQSYGFVAACSGFHPLVLMPQCETIAWPPESRLMQRFCRYAIRRADWINSLGAHMTGSLLRLGADPKRIDTYPAGVRSDCFFPPERPVGERERTLISTRALAPEYHQDLVIRAVDVLRRRHAMEVRYWIVGDGAERARLERLAHELELSSQVRFFGHQPPHQVGELLRQAAVYVALVSTDGVSASLLEAMACGAFPIVPDMPANRLWVDDGVSGSLLSTDGWVPDSVAGFRQPADRGEQLADRIAAALADPELRRRAAGVNLELVRQQADWATNLGRMEASLRKLTARTEARL